MGYVATSLLTILIVYIFINKINSIQRIVIPKNTKKQSDLVIKPVLKQKRVRKTQSMNLIQKRMSKILFYNNDAYWINNNTFYKAKTNNSQIDKNTIEKVDIMHMDKVELNRMIFIVDKLTERD